MTQIIAPQDIQLEIEYSITVSPADTFQFWNQIDSERIKKATNHMQYIIRRTPNIHYKLHLDVSRTGRIHWHGTIKFISVQAIREFYLEIIHRLLEDHKIEIDTIKDAKVWHEYCTKIKHLWDVVVQTKDVLKNLKKGPIKYKQIEFQEEDSAH